MRYELLKDATVGVITDPAPVLLDMQDTFKIYFDVPEPGGYAAMFRGEDNIERKVSIKKGEALIPKELLKKAQRVAVSVLRTDGPVCKAWDCPPLRVDTFLQLRQTMLQITAGLSDSELYERIAEMERAYVEAQAEHAKAIAEYEALKAEYLDYKTQMDASVQVLAAAQEKQANELASHRESYEKLATAYNELIKVVNDLSTRMHEVEKHYDPSVI